MPIVTCDGCGRLTNTAVSSVADQGDWGKKATSCAAAFENGKWVKGCAYGGVDEVERALVDKLLNHAGDEKPSEPALTKDDFKKPAWTKPDFPADAR